MSKKTGIDKLSEMTTLALRVHRELRSKIARRADGEPVPGDLLVFERTSAYPVEWLLLERQAATPDVVWLAPADTNPSVGSGDIQLPESVPSGPLVLRCRHTLWVDLTTLSRPRITGKVDSAFVDEALRLRRRIEAGELRASAWEEETDLDPEYQLWCREVIEVARRLLDDPSIDEGADAAQASQIVTPEAPIA